MRIIYPQKKNINFKRGQNVTKFHIITSIVQGLNQREGTKSAHETNVYISGVPLSAMTGYICSSLYTPNVLEPVHT